MKIEKIAEDTNFRRIDISDFIENYRTPYITVWENKGRLPRCEPAFFDTIRDSPEAFLSMATGLQEAARIMTEWKLKPL